MKFYIVQTIYYGQKLIVLASCGADAVTKAKNALENETGRKWSINDFKATELQACMLSDDVCWL